MLVFIAILLVAFVPALIYVTFFRLLDIYEKEPLWLVVVAFLWGAIPAVIFALIGEAIGSVAVSAAANADPGSVDAITATALAPLMEELAKGLFLGLLILAFRRQLDSPLDGLIIGATVGLGFAASENVLYLLGGYVDGGTGGLVLVAVLRIVFLGFAHALFTGITGLGFSYARFGHGAWKVFGPILGLIGGMSLHAIWNGTLSFGSEVGGILPLLIVLVIHWAVVIGMFVLVGFIWAWERKWMRVELNEEVQWGLVRPDEVQRACSAWGRIGTQLGSFFTGGPGSLRAKNHFYRDLSALALCKHNLRTLNDDPKGAAEIQQIRARLSTDRARAGL